MIPIVSVIIPIYNAEKTIAKTIESLINQTFKSFEIICVDDGSKDKSLEILKELAAKNNFIKILTQKNSGPAKARNVAINQAMGNFIMFCDADDWYEPNMIEEMVKTMQEHNTDIVMCDCNVIDLSNKKLHTKSDIEWCYLKHKGYYKLNSKIKDEINTVIWNKLFKKELIDKYNITYPTKFEHDDSMFFWKYIFACSTFYGIDKKLYNYVVGNPNSVSGKYRIQKNNPHQFDFILSLQEIFDFIQNTDFENDYKIYIKHSIGTIKFFYKMLSKKSRKKAFKHIKKLVRKNIDFLKIYEEDFCYINKIYKFKTFENYVFNNIKERESILKDIFSIHNEDCRKVISILGLKLKIKSKKLEINKNLVDIKNNQNKFFTQIELIKKQNNELKQTLLGDIDNINSHIDAIKATIYDFKPYVNEYLKGISTKISNIENNVNRVEQKILFDNVFQIGFCRNFNKGLENIDLKNKYKNLIKNLDKESIKCVSKVFSQISLIKSNPAKAYDIFTEEEQEQIKKIKKEFHNEIIQLSDDCFAYQNYLLPINYFEASVFYYKHQLDTLKNVNKFKNKDIIDVGGFIGDSALIFSEYTNKNVYCFEPVNQNYDLILKTIELNDCNNIFPVKCGLGSLETTQKISIDKSCSSINQPLDRVQNFEEIEIVTLDKYVQENNLDVGLIKVDTEGYEQEFLKGAIETIKKFKPTLLISIYHNTSDFFDIKPLIESWNLNYSLKIVRPTDGGILCETLLIAEQLEDLDND